jgi:hypothetical protein
VSLIWSSSAPPTASVITREHPDVRVVILTAHAQEALIRRSALAGACCLLPKSGSLPRSAPGAADGVQERLRRAPARGAPSLTRPSTMGAARLWATLAARSCASRSASSSAMCWLTKIAPRLSTMRETRLDPTNRSRALAHVYADRDASGRDAPVVRVLRNRMRDGAVLHIKLWSEDGRVIWSDETAEIGRRFKLTSQVQELFGTRDAISERSEPGGETEAGEPDKSPLVEVYVGSRDADGVPLVVESYLSPESVQRDVGAIISQVLPLGLGALLVFRSPLCRWPCPWRATCARARSSAP